MMSAEAKNQQTSLAGSDISEEEKALQAKRAEKRKKYHIMSLALTGVIVVCLLVYLFAAQKCLVFGHKWEAATCTTAKTCRVCATADGSPFGHKWEAATCTSAKTCSVCGGIEGAPLDHKWEAATCTSAKICTVCAAVEGAPLDHNWQAATCSSSKTCLLCGAVDGVALDHNWLEATCTTPKTCRECGEESGSAWGHAWEEATYSSPRTCSICKMTDGEPLVNPLADLIRDRLPIVTYALSSAQKVYGYEDAELTKKSDSYYFNASTDEIVILDISENGAALKVRYPSSKTKSGYRTLWFPFEDIICLDEIEIGNGSVYQRTNTFWYSISGNTLIRYGSMEQGGKYVILGEHKTGYMAIMYEIYSKRIYDLNVGYKLALLEP